MKWLRKILGVKGASHGALATALRDVSAVLRGREQVPRALHCSARTADDSGDALQMPDFHKFTIAAIGERGQFAAACVDCDKTVVGTPGKNAWAVAGFAKRKFREYSGREHRITMGKPCETNRPPPPVEPPPIYGT